MQRIRTLAEIEFMAAICTNRFFLYQDVRERALKLHRLGMNYSEIAQALGISDKTAKKAVIRIL